MEKIQLSTFQKDVSVVIELVRSSEEPVLITQNGKSLVKIVPITEAAPSWLGCMQSKGRILGDIVSPVADTDEWEVLSL